MTGLGVTTVSRALKDAPEIGEETRRRVQLVARQVGYRPNRAGVRLRTGKTNVISLVLNTEEQIGGFVSDMIYGISEHLAQTPYHLIVTPYSRTNDPLEPVRYVVETGSADGIIISRTEPDDKRVRYMLERGFPFATHGRTEIGTEHAVPRLRQLCLRARGGEEARRARPQAAGAARRRRRRFPTTITCATASSTRWREIGLAEIPFNTVTVDHSIEQIRARTAAADAARTTARTASSAARGGATFALVAGIEDAGLKVGADVDIVSKQSAKLLHLFRPELHVVNEDVRLAGRELARSVIALIDGAPAQSLQSLSLPGPVLARGNERGGKVPRPTGD